MNLSPDQLGWLREHLSEFLLEQTECGSEALNDGEFEDAKIHDEEAFMAASILSALQPYCKNLEAHARFSERGLDCPHCPVTA